MIFTFAPIVGFLLGVSAITVLWGILFLSVLLYIVIPVMFAHQWRIRILRNGDEAQFQRILHRLQPASLVALLATLVGKSDPGPSTDHRHAGGIDLDPGLFKSGLAYVLNCQLGGGTPRGFTFCPDGTSNFFELAVAAAISLFGFDSGAALATVVGVLARNAAFGWHSKPETPRLLLLRVYMGLEHLVHQLEVLLIGQLTFGGDL